MRPLAILLALLLALAAGPASPATQRRIALVVGMGQYNYAQHLPNPPQDAHAIAQSLGKLGFDVDERIDIDFRSLARAVREFGIKAQTADVAVFYYAGHGMQVDRSNYLIPIDAKLERQRDLVYEAMPLDLVMGEISQAHMLGIVILDACRNNPFAEHLISQGEQQARGEVRAISVGQGLARVDDTPKDTLVAMATRSDAVAEDGDGPHSPYSQALLANLEVPGLELGLFFRRVRDEVLKATRGRQEPYTFGSLGAEPFYFNPLPPNRQPVVPALAPLEMAADAGARKLAVTGLEDPDNDRLAVRLTALPKGGSLRLGDRQLLIGDTLTPEQLANATFTPDGSFTGQAGPLSFTVEDGRGGSVPASLFLKINPANKPPLVEAEQQLEVKPASLGLRPPTDPDGDPLTITVTAVPERGSVRTEGGQAVKAGDRLDPAMLERLVYIPETAPGGEAGIFGYMVEDGRGGRAGGKVHITIAGPPALAAAPAPSPTPAAKEVAAALPPPAPSPPPPVPEKAPVQPAVGLFPAPEGSLRDCDHCPVLVTIKPGTFQMGSAGGDPSSRPAHKVTLGKEFAIGKYEVTMGEWRACIAAGACKDIPELATADDRRPVHNIDWDDAQAYVGWLSQVTGHRYRLPSEAEWEYAARGGTQTTFWWGDGLGQGKADCTDCGGDYDRAAPAVVDAFPANPFGLQGTSGGVAEWVEDCWFPSHAGAPRTESPRDKKGCRTRVLRGGSWLNDHSYATSAGRFFYDANVRYIANGFRVARDMD